jgi:hypothetical protein
MYLELAEEPLFLSKRSRRKRGGIFKKVFQAGKKVGLSAPRTAYLGLVALNVRGWASMLQKADQAKLKGLWEKLGGKWSNLQKAIESGSKKKQLFDNGTMYSMDEEAGKIYTLDAAPAAAAIAAAAPIIAAFAPLLKALFPNNPEAQKAIDDVAAAAKEAEPEGYQDPTKNPNQFSAEVGQEGKPGMNTGAGSFFSSIPKPALYIGGGLAALLLVTTLMKRK